MEGRSIIFNLDFFIFIIPIISEKSILNFFRKYIPEERKCLVHHLYLVFSMINNIRIIEIFKKFYFFLQNEVTNFIIVTD